MKKVLANAMFYARELEQPLRPAVDRLGTVPPRATPRRRRRRVAADRREGAVTMATDTVLVLGGSGFVGRHLVSRPRAVRACAWSCRRAGARARVT